jgi:hypothetical protein
MVSRTKSKINLQRIIVKDGNVEAKGVVFHSDRFSVSGNTLSFKAGGRYTTVFIKPVITSV